MKRYRSLSELPDYVRELVTSGHTRGTGMLCPECQGGRERERSLGVYRIGNELVLKCYRIKCGHLGKLWLAAGEAPAAPEGGFEPRPFLGDMHELSPAATGYLHRRYRITPDTLRALGVKEVIGREAIYMPVYGPFTNERGGVVRRFDGWGQKADSYKTADEPWQAWYLRIEPKGLVLVEDQLSAIRCWQLGYTAVALLGAEMTMDRAGELSRYAASPVMLALDADAFSAACKIAQRHSWIDRVVMLKHDLKDIADSEIEARLCG